MRRIVTGGYRAEAEVIGSQERSDGRREVVARVLTYDVADSFGTEWAEGAFVASLAEKLPTWVRQHHRSEIIGRVVEYSDGPDGLELTMLSDPLETSRVAAEVLGVMDQDEADIEAGLARAGDRRYQYSVGFAAVEVGYADAGVGMVDESSWARILQADLIEISSVVGPSVPGTETLSVRDGLMRMGDIAALLSRSTAGGAHSDVDALLGRVLRGGVEEKRQAVELPERLRQSRRILGGRR